MKRTMTILGAVAAAFLLAGRVYAQESEPTLASKEAAPARLAVNAGVSYRNFRSTRFGSGALPAFKGVFAQSGVAGNVVDYNSGIGAVGVDAFGNAFRDVAVVVHHSGGSFSASDDADFADCLAPALGISYDLWQDKGLALAAVAGIQYYNLNTKATAAGNTGTEFSTYQTVLPTLPPAPERDAHGSNYLSARGKADFELDLYALDLGMRLDFNAFKALSLFVALGPSVALADMDSSAAAVLVRNLDGAALARQADSDSSQDWVFGVYVSCGAAYWFSERFGAALEIRCDEAFSHASTRYANQDIDSFGGMLKLMARF